MKLLFSWPFLFFIRGIVNTLQPCNASPLCRLDTGLVECVKSYCSVYSPLGWGDVLGGRGLSVQYATPKSREEGGFDNGWNPCSKFLMWGCVSILWHSFLSSSPFLHDHWQVKGLDRLSLNCYHLPSPDQRLWKGSCFNVGDGNNVCIQYKIPSPLVPSHHAHVLNLLTPNGFAINMLQLQNDTKVTCSMCDNTKSRIN